MKVTQHDKILQAFKDNNGVINSYTARSELKIIQLPTRISELKGKGWQITSETKEDRSVDYKLDYKEKVRIVKFWNNGILEEARLDTI